MVIAYYCSREFRRCTGDGRGYSKTFEKFTIACESPSFRLATMASEAMLTDDREGTEGGFILYWKKQRMRGCTSCKSQSPTSLNLTRVVADLRL